MTWRCWGCSAMSGHRRSEDRCQRKDEREDRAAVRPGIHPDAAAMRFHDLRDDGETQPGAVRGRRVAAPEALEDPRAIFLRYARPAVADVDAAAGARADRDFGARRRVDDRILDQVADRVVDGIGVAADNDRSVGPDEGDGPPLRQRPWRQ